MLTATVTERAGGFVLAGDLLDLQGLHRSLHEMCAADCDEDDYPANLVLQLAYDVRKAFEGQRERIKVESFEGRQATYRCVTLSLARAAIQFGFLVKLVSRGAAPIRRTAAIHAFGAAVASALEQLEIPSPEKYLGTVVQRVAGWSDWPPAFLVDAIDRDFLFEARTRAARLKRLKEMPGKLRSGGSFAAQVLRTRDTFAADQGITVEMVGVAWPDEHPLY